MAPVATTNLSSMLRRHMSAKGYSQFIISQRVGLSSATIGSFLRNKKSPHRATQEKIEDYLKNEGVLTRFGFPTEPLPVMQQEDKEQLRDMGIRPYEARRLELSTEDKRFLTYAILHAHADKEYKHDLLSRLGL